MAKSKKVVSKKVVGPVAPVEAPVVPASEPVQAEAVAPTPASAPVPATDKRAPQGAGSREAGRSRRRGPRAVEASPGSVAGKGGGGGRGCQGADDGGARRHSLQFCRW